MPALEELLVSGKAINRELVAEVLSPFIKIDRDTCEIIPTAAWRKLSNEAKTLLYLTARKAMVALEVPVGPESATPQEIERGTGVIGNSLRPLLKRLSEQRILAKADGRYFVPNYALQDVKDCLSERAKG